MLKPRIPVPEIPGGCPVDGPLDHRHPFGGGAGVLLRHADRGPYHQNYQQQLQLYAAAQGSVQRAIAELIFKHDPRIQQLRKAAKEEEIPAENKIGLPMAGSIVYP